MRKYIPYILILLAFSGMLDAGYLTIEHYNKSIPPCYDVPFSDCGQVLASPYSVVFGIPLALLGVFHYLSFVIILVYAAIGKRTKFRYLALLTSTVGFVVSLALVFIQLFVLKAICTYCMLSAFISFTLFFLTHFFFWKERKKATIFLFGLFYRNIAKKTLFLFDPAVVHDAITDTSAFAGKFPWIRSFSSFLFAYAHPRLQQKIAGIEFPNPIGLAAGFDHDAKLTQILPQAGFGFQSVGTITYKPYAGNPLPILGRLPESQSLMVNKGFKNPGAEAVAENLKTLAFQNPMGISIGRTNGVDMTQKQSIADIIKTFTLFEKAGVRNAYYELNISCPNLYGDVSFYPPKNLKELLTALDKLKLKKPVFIKMPIDKTDKEILAMLKIIAQHSPVGVIFGNLQTNRNDPSLKKYEVDRFNVGKFSGKPTYKRSNELISLTYNRYKKRFVIIGCGGVFSAEDAYEKITRGASLVQLITGMIFVGPGLIGDINIRLQERLEKEGYKSITDAVGSKYK